MCNCFILKHLDPYQKQLLTSLFFFYRTSAFSYLAASACIGLALGNFNGIHTYTEFVSSNV